MGTKAYNQAYSYKEYKEAEDYSDLLTAFAHDIELVEADYRKYGYPDRKRKFDLSDNEEAYNHSITAPVERHIDIAFDHLRDWVVRPDEEAHIQKIYNKRIKGWNDSTANRVENKIENAKEIIAWFQKEYPIILRRSFYFEEKAIYVGNGNYAFLPKGSNYCYIAKILFMDIHRHWTESEIIYELALLKNITPHTKEFDDLKKVSIKRSCQLINNKVSESIGGETVLIIYSKQSVSFNLSLFRQIDRTISK